MCISDFYFLDVENENNNTCKKCPFPFLRCTDMNTPLECVGNNIDRKVENNCLCPEGYSNF